MVCNDCTRICSFFTERYGYGCEFI